MSKTQIGTDPGRSNGATGLFVRRFLAQPLAVAACLPSSPAFSRAIARHLQGSRNDYVLELGAGTGSVTRALRAAGVPEDRLVLVEIDPEMADYLRHAFPKAHVIAGSVFDLPDALPQEVADKIGDVVCGVPLALFTLEEQKRLTGLMLDLLPPGRSFLMLTYRPAAPIPGPRLGLTGKRLETVLLNVPPGSVWGYARNGAAHG
jgi:phosphatidylethanolamine/phosphatidyl-N-methylethanolamine N-methyltransferase